MITEFNFDTDSDYYGSDCDCSEYEPDEDRAIPKKTKK
ncbi:unnamed protein product, partial [Brachionus calyciflorus]